MTIKGLLEHIQQTLCGHGELLAKIIARTNHLAERLEILMSVAQDIKKALAALDAETTLVANNIAALAAQIHNGMTDAEVADINASFTLLSDRLKALAVDPAAPVPPPPATLLALRSKI